jgi:hypothetical protein
MGDIEPRLSRVKIGFWILLVTLALSMLVLVLAPTLRNHVVPLSHSEVSDCINNLRNIEAAKNEWALINNKTTNDIPTWADIKDYIKRLERDKPYLKFEVDPESGLPKCPSGGIYVIGKVGEVPTCSLGSTITPNHILP